MHHVQTTLGDVDKRMWLAVHYAQTYSFICLEQCTELYLRVIEDVYALACF